MYTNREWRLLSWWLAEFHPAAECWMNVRVGPTEPLAGVFAEGAAAINASRLRNRWADAIYLENGRPYLVEAKLQPDPGIFSTLLHYARKFRVDPFFGRWSASPLGLIALVARNDPSVEQEAPWYGVRWVVYQPPWLGSEFTETTGNAPIDVELPIPGSWSYQWMPILRGVGRENPQGPGP